MPLGNDQFAVVKESAAGINDVRHVAFTLLLVRFEQGFAEAAYHFAGIVVIEEERADAVRSQGADTVAEDPQFYLPEIHNSLHCSRLQTMPIISISYGVRIARTIRMPRLPWAGFHSFVDSMDSTRFRVRGPVKAAVVVRGDEQREIGAGDGDRTRNHRLGKPMIYHCATP